MEPPRIKLGVCWGGSPQPGGWGGREAQCTHATERRSQPHMHLAHGWLRHLDDCDEPKTVTKWTQSWSARLKMVCWTYGRIYISGLVLLSRSPELFFVDLGSIV